MSGVLQRNLTAFKTREGWFGGIPGDVVAPTWSWFGTEPGAAMRVADYGYWVEYGRNGQAERPLFRPTLEEFIEEGWPKLADMTISKIMEAWR